MNGSFYGGVLKNKSTLLSDGTLIVVQYCPQTIV